MRDRVRAVVRRPEGGYVSMAVGSLWETIEAAHNWTYICELAKEAGPFRALLELAHPSPLAMVVLGFVWAAGAHLLRRRSVLSSRDNGVVVGSLDANKLIRAVLETPDRVLLQAQNADGSGFTLVKGDQRDATFEPTLRKVANSKGRGS